MSIYGAWAEPPPCNTSDQCHDLLLLASPGATGNAYCYPNLLSENLTNPDLAQGGCACDSSQGLGGLTCNELTSYSPTAQALGILPAVICGLVIIRFGRIFVGLVAHPFLWKLNAAGTSFVFTWIALLSTFINSSSNVAQQFQTVSASVQTLITVTGRMQIIFLTISVLNLVAAFVEMSSSVRLIQNIDKLRIPVIVTVVIAACAIIFTFLFASNEASAAVGLVVVFALSVLSIIGPIVLYVRASARMARTEGQKPLTRSRMFMAIVSEVCLESKQMRRLLGFTRSHSSHDSKDSKDSRDSREPMEINVVPHADLTQEARASTAQDDDVKRGSKRKPHIPSKSAFATKREEKMVSFLSRAVNMGFWISLSLLSFLITVGFQVVLDPLFETGSYRPSGVIGLLNILFLISALYQILWFLNPGYAKLIAQRKQVSRYRSESKDAVPSKEETKLEANDSKAPASTGHSREVAPVGPSSIVATREAAALAVHSGANGV